MDNKNTSNINDIELDSFGYVLKNHDNAKKLAFKISTKRSLLIPLASPYSQFTIYISKVDYTLDNESYTHGFSSIHNEDMLFISVIDHRSYIFNLDITSNKLSKYSKLQDMSYYNDSDYNSFVCYMCEKLGINQFSNDLEVVEFLAIISIVLVDITGQVKDN
jgi:hypothetical protein